MDLASGLPLHCHWLAATQGARAGGGDAGHSSGQAAHAGAGAAAAARTTAAAAGVTVGTIEDTGLRACSRPLWLHNHHSSAQSSFEQQPVFLAGFS